MLHIRIKKLSSRCIGQMGTVQPSKSQRTNNQPASVTIPMKKEVTQPKFRWYFNLPEWWKKWLKIWKVFGAAAWKRHQHNWIFPMSSAVVSIWRVSPFQSWKVKTQNWKINLTIVSKIGSIPQLIWDRPNWRSWYAHIDLYKSLPITKWT